MSHQKGFGLVGFIVSLAIIGCVVGSGIYLYSLHHIPVKKTSSTTTSVVKHPTVPLNGTLVGSTVLDTGCTAQKVNTACTTQPIAATVTITGMNGTVFSTSTQTDNQGHFSLSLSPGNYSITAKSANTKNPISSFATQYTTIESSKASNLTILFVSTTKIY